MPQKNVDELHLTPKEAALIYNELQLLKEKLGQLPQRQDSITDQMKTIINEGNRLGCYDAVDWIVARFWGI
jgi:hypothetical protein